MAFRFVYRNPALAPLFFAVGLGCFGAVGYGIYKLSFDPDVLTQRWVNPTPHNNVRQDQNTKFWSPNREFWASRVGIADPRAAFLAAESAAEKAGSKAVQKVKEISAKVTEGP
ncbi:hypothetical protein DACRYDRAFT_21256 [Dacryopinax primogenitus]|uniref:NADH-ubiquinone reductase complex 1 MLRQ subunit n=1 Tax=Dacryopinax primogenitus (strain DJM 731) TaxID=1858805 RepID=M5GF43_DACPD|nr:uncharacterized protein DACRYDRAFT_21256 [Dacryopinax primogenitus]EJU03823.1 hypothetical protein DACRYDRAFT_21256 [Dacryopinax primogenitus]